MEERQYWINESKKLNIGYGTFYSRVYTLGWSYEKAATTPLKRRKNKWLDLARERGIHPSTYHNRKLRGWTDEEAATTPVNDRIDYGKWTKVADSNDIPRHTFYTRVKKLGWSCEKAATTPAKRIGRGAYKGNQPEYLVYRGEEMVADGTLDECAEITGASKSYLRWLATPAGQKRKEQTKNIKSGLVVMRLEDDDD